MKLTIQYHAGNPELCRIPELKIGVMPECEGGGWYMPREQAEAILRAMSAEQKLKSFRDGAEHLWTHPTTRHLYTVESIAASMLEEIAA